MDDMTSVTPIQSESTVLNQQYAILSTTNDNAMPNTTAGSQLFDVNGGNAGVGQMNGAVSAGRASSSNSPGNTNIAAGMAALAAGLHPQELASICHGLMGTNKKTSRPSDDDSGTNGTNGSPSDSDRSPSVRSSIRTNETKKGRNEETSMELRAKKWNYIDELRNPRDGREWHARAVILACTARLQHKHGTVSKWYDTGRFAAFPNVEAVQSFGGLSILLSKYKDVEKEDSSRVGTIGAGIGGALGGVARWTIRPKIAAKRSAVSKDSKFKRSKSSWLRTYGSGKAFRDKFRKHFLAAERLQLVNGEIKPLPIPHTGALYTGDVDEERQRCAVYSIRKAYLTNMQGRRRKLYEDLYKTTFVQAHKVLLVNPSNSAKGKNRLIFDESETEALLARDGTQALLDVPALPQLDPKKDHSTKAWTDWSKSNYSTFVALSEKYKRFVVTLVYETEVGGTDESTALPLDPADAQKQLANEYKKFAEVHPAVPFATYAHYRPVRPTGIVPREKEINLHKLAASSLAGYTRLTIPEFLDSHVQSLRAIHATALALSFVLRETFNARTLPVELDAAGNLTILNRSGQTDPLSIFKGVSPPAFPANIKGERGYFTESFKDYCEYVVMKNVQEQGLANNVLSTIIDNSAGDEPDELDLMHY